LQKFLIDTGLTISTIQANNREKISYS